MHVTRTAPGTPMPTDTRAWLRLLVATAALFTAYQPSLGADFLNYDDNWMIEYNDILKLPPSEAVRAMITDFSRQTRLELGAEYFPVRDLFVWAEVRLFGTHAPSMRLVSLGLYLAALFILREGSLRTFQHARWVDLAVIAFALHPVHAESVAWTTGQKELLALVFVFGALCLHAGESAHARVSVPLMVLLAMLSKSMSVSVLVLMLAQDLVMRRRLEPVRYTLCALVLACTMAIHVQVGQIMAFTLPPAGGSPWTAAMTMSVVMLRYLLTSLAPFALSVRYDVPDRLHWDAPAIASVLAVALLAGLAWRAYRRGQRLPAWAFLWFFGALLPVSQVMFQLQTRMADRYLWLAVWAPCVLGAWSLAALSSRVGRARPAVIALGMAYGAALFIACLQRAVLFSDPVLLFSDALAKTEHDLHAPYHLGWAFERRGRDAEAIAAYALVAQRASADDRSEKIARAEQSLAQLLAKRGRIDEANAVLDRLRARFADPRPARASVEHEH